MATTTRRSLSVVVVVTDTNTAPPATLLVLYVLGECDREWWTETDLRDEIAATTGYEVTPSTVHRAVRNLSEVGRIKKRVRRSDGTTATEYRLHNANGEGIDMTTSR